MKDWHHTLLSPNATILDALQMLNNAGCQICLVVDDTHRLLGSITDGDIRRGILVGIDMTQSVKKVMNPHPRWSSPDSPTSKLLEIMRAHTVRHLPLLDRDGRVVGLARLDDLSTPTPSKDNAVILMAGGQGKRLRPLTEDTPKPLLPVGGRPILERILEELIAQGFRRFHMSVNYRAEMIIAHFGDGKKWGVDIDYIHEDQPLGTAGPLGLLPDTGPLPIIVMNGDLLTQVNLPHLLDYHQQRGAHASMGVRKYDFQVPFGVVRLDGDEMIGIDEKPTHEFFVNAGIYTLEPSVLKLITPGQPMDMPALFQLARAKDLRTIAFPIHEYWMDIGRLDDFDKANAEIGHISNNGN